MVDGVDDAPFSLDPHQVEKGTLFAVPFRGAHPPERMGGGEDHHKFEDVLRGYRYSAKESQSNSI